MQAPGAESYRVVRHRSAEGEVHRAVVDDGTGAAELLVVPEASRGAWEHQVRVMGECPSPHLPSVRDLAIDPDGTLRIIRTLVTGERLDGLLATPGWCTPGRTVTLLHPMVVTLRTAHDLGAVLGGPDIGRIVVTADGRPIIAELAGAFRAAPLPTHLRAKDPAHLADVQALERVRLAAVRALDAAGFSDTAASLPEIVDALDDPDVLLRWSAAEPLVGAAPGADSAAHRRAVTDDGQQEPHHERIGVTATLARVTQQVGLPQTVTTLVERAVSDMTERCQRIRAAATRLPRRSLIMAAAGVAVVAAVVIVAVVPSPSGDASSGVAEATTDHPETSISPADDAFDGRAEDADDPTLMAHPDDWLIVVSELVRRWQSCVHELRLLCDNALHASSSAAESRAAGRDSVLAALAPLVDSDRVDVIVLERSGDAVVVSLTAPETTPASLLMIRSEAGWRIRDAWT